jgi:hypothetical protein
MNEESSPGEPQLGDCVDGQILVAVGLDFTFTEILPSHQELFQLLDQWLTSIRTYSFENRFGTEANLWDELEDCGYEIGEGEIEDSVKAKTLKLYDVWVANESLPDALLQVQNRVQEFAKIALELIPPGLHPTAKTNPAPKALIELIAKLEEPE